MKRIVITGVSRGLGAALTGVFAAQGHQVIGCASSVSGVTQLRERCGAPHEFAQVDVADFAQVSAWAQDVTDRVGPPDLVLNNAGLINELAPLWKVPPESFSRIVDVNIKGVAHVIAAFVPPMIARGSGVIVNFSSGWGRSIDAGVAPYCATKWAIEGLSKALAAELPAGMASIPLNPGIIHTDMLDICFGDAAAEYPDAEAWAVRAAPFLLRLGRSDNGRSLTVPGF